MILPTKMNSITGVNDLNLFSYQQLLSEIESGNLYQSAASQRKCIAQLLKASFNSLGNDDTCNLLDQKLNQYSETVFSENANIYDNQLKHLLTQANRSLSCNFKSNLDKINGSEYLKPLLCSDTDQAHSCTSEIEVENEFDEFSDVFHDQRPKANSISMHLNEKQINDIRCSEPKRECSYRKSEDGNVSINFRTAKDELQYQNLKKYGNSYSQQNVFSSNTGGQKRKLGTRRNINSKFISPLIPNNDSIEEIKSDEWPSDVDERLKNIEPKMVEIIKSEIMDCGPSIHWNDIAGLSFAKTAIQEAVVWPMLRPDIFTGLRRPPKGILLFGPPGTGKTLIGKCVASQSKSTFFSISASSLTSKWVGDGEKMVRALFVVAHVHQPAVIFIDEIDSLLSQRSDTEHESSRRIKTEFLVQLDGATTDNEERILVIGATNRPQELDDAARRRFVKRLYIPLPEFEARLQLVNKLIYNEKHSLKDDDFKEIATMSDGYSGADIRNLCSEASLGPIRSIDMSLIEQIQATEVRPLTMDDFIQAFNRVKSSVSPKDLEQYITWDRTYGSGCGF